MGYHKANKSGLTTINVGSKDKPKPLNVKFAKGDIIEEKYPQADIKKGTFDHVDEDVIEYNTGTPPKEGEASPDEGSAEEEKEG